MLLDRNWALLHWTDFPEQPYPLESWLKLEKDTIPFPDAFRESFPPDFEKLQKPIVRLLNVVGSEHQVHCTVLPVYFQAKHYGFIVLCDPLAKLDEHSYIALENGAMAFSLERIRSEEVERARNRIRRDFLDELLMGKITSKETLNNLADLHGINLQLEYTALIFPVECLEYRNVKDLVRRNQLEDAKMKQLLKHFDGLANVLKRAQIVFSRKKQIIVLLGSHVGEAVDLKKVAEEIITLTDTAFPEITMKATIGKTVPHISQIHESFHQAQETLRLAENRLTNSQQKVLHFSDFIVQHLLIHNIEQTELRKFFHYTLGSLYQHDVENNGALLETLNTLVANRFNIAETSRMLYIHRNTLLYRMEKIEDILQVDLKDAEELLKIQLGLKIYHLLRLDYMDEMSLLPRF